MNVRKVTLLMTATIALAAVASASATTGHSIHRRTVGFAIGTRYFRSHARLGKQRGFAAAFDLRGGLGSGSALVGSAPVGNGPGGCSRSTRRPTRCTSPTASTTTATAVGGNTVSVIDTRHCNARRRLALQGSVADDHGREPCPSGIAIDEQTDTVYVSNVADNTVSVFNGATCNALEHVRLRADAGDRPRRVDAARDLRRPGQPHRVRPQRSARHDVSMIDSATCNATDLAACPTTRAPDRRRRSGTATTSTSTRRPTPCT